MIKFLLGQLHGHRVAVVTAITMTLLQVGADVLGALPIKWVLDAVVDHRDPEVGPLDPLLDLFQGIQFAGGTGEKHERAAIAVVAFAAFMYVAFGVLGSVLAYAQMRLATSISQSVSARLRTTLFARIESLPLDWHARHRTGDLIQRVTGNITDIEKLLTDGLIDLLAGLLTIIGIISVMVALDWRFTLVSIGIVPVMFIVTLYYTLAIKAASRRAAKAAGRVTDVAAEDIRAITEVKSFTLEQHEAERFADKVADLRRNTTLAGRLQAEFTPAVQIVITAGTAIVIGIGGAVAVGYDVSLGVTTLPAESLSIGTLTVFLAYLKQLYQPMRNLSKLTNMVAIAASGAERIVEILDAEPEKLDPPGEWIDRSPMPRARGEIRLSGVSFGYTPGVPVLDDISLHLPAGGRVALVGLSGSGKSTLVKLIPRLHTAWSGTITIDGRDVRGLALRDLRRDISFVPQESVLFEGTVRSNVAVGRPDATEEEIFDACRKAHVHDAVLELSQGYDTPVGEAGRNLSTGQRQRIAIARAILRDSPILILDEPTASLDVEAEAEVMHALDTLIEGRTVLMISHRLSTLGDVDEIVVLDQGRIAERGAPHVLAQAGGIFTRMLTEQHRYSSLTLDERPAEFDEETDNLETRANARQLRLPSSETRPLEVRLRLR